MMSNDEGISAFPDSDNMLLWTATISGTKETPYSGTQPDPRRGMLFTFCFCELDPSIFHCHRC